MGRKKENNKTTYTAVMRTDLLEKIRQDAKEDNRSLGNYVETIVMRYYEMLDKTKTG